MSPAEKVSFESTPTLDTQTVPIAASSTEVLVARSSPILRLNHYDEIDDVDPKLDPLRLLQWLFQCYSRKGVPLENATVASEQALSLHLRRNS